MEERQEASRHRPDGLRRDEAVADEQLGQLAGIPRVQPSTKPPLGDLEEGVTMDKRAQVHKRFLLSGFRNAEVSDRVQARFGGPICWLHASVVFSSL